MATRRKDVPNWGGYALNSGGVGDLTPQSKDDELKTKTKKKPDTSPDPEHSVGGPKVKRSLTHEYRSSVDDAAR